MTLEELRQVGAGASLKLRGIPVIAQPPSVESGLIDLISALGSSRWAVSNRGEIVPLTLTNARGRFLRGYGAPVYTLADLTAVAT